MRGAANAGRGWEFVDAGRCVGSCGLQLTFGGGCHPFRRVVVQLRRGLGSNLCKAPSIQVFFIILLFFFIFIFLFFPSLFLSFCLSSFNFFLDFPLIYLIIFNYFLVFILIILIGFFFFFFAFSMCLLRSESAERRGTD